jgi:sugar transferase (PEP-CTERM/EpsH1 system associated)
MKLFVILSRVPYPLEKGDKLRAYNQLKELSKNNEIFLFALNDTIQHPQALTELKKYCKEIHIEKLTGIAIFFNLLRSVFNTLPFQVGYFYNNRIKKKILNKINFFKPDHIYCQLIRTSEYAKDIKHIPKTLDYMDAFSKGVERRKKTQPFYLKPFFNWEYKKVLRYEGEIFSHFEHCTIISEQDKEAVPHKDKNLITVIQNGVDINFFKPIVREKKFDLVFNGNMNYPPNIESAEFLSKKIMPLVHAVIPGATLLISGASPSAEVLKLQNNHITISGWVDDVRENYASAKINIAPMLISIGLQNKLLEAMAMQMPCITSTMANNALGAKSGIEILTADTPQQYAQHIITLLNDAPRSNEIASNGYKFATQNFSWDKSTKQLEELMKSHHNPIS